MERRQQEGDVVDENNHVQWAFIYISDNVQNAQDKLQSGNVTLGMVGQRWHPRVLGVHVDQAIWLSNDDSEPHTAHVLGIQGSTCFLRPSGARETLVLKLPEIMSSVECDIHPFERAWIGVMTHPYFAVSDSDGKFEITDIPPGRYQVQVWHEKYASVTQEVEIRAGESVDLAPILSNRK